MSVQVMDTTSTAVVTQDDVGARDEANMIRVAGRSDHAVHMLQTFRKLYEGSEMCDMSIRTSSGAIECHSLVVSVFSEFVKTKSERWTNKPESVCVNLDHHNPCEVRSFVDFCYGVTHQVNNKSLAHALALSDEIMAPQYTSAIISAAVATIDTETVFDIYHAAHLYGHFNLEMACVAFARRKFCVLHKEGRLEHVTTDELCLILEGPDMGDNEDVCDEAAVLAGVRGWQEANGASDEDVAKVLSYVRMALIPSGILKTTREEWDAIKRPLANTVLVNALLDGTSSQAARGHFESFKTSSDCAIWASSSDNVTCRRLSKARGGFELTRGTAHGCDVAMSGVIPSTGRVQFEVVTSPHNVLYLGVATSNVRRRSYPGTGVNPVWCLNTKDLTFCGPNIAKHRLCNRADDLKRVGQRTVVMTVDADSMTVTYEFDDDGIEMIALGPSPSDSAPMPNESLFAYLCIQNSGLNCTVRQIETLHDCTLETSHTTLEFEREVEMALTE